MVVDWYSENERFFQTKTPLKVMKEVYDQASRHMERQDRNAILDRQRPNEEESAKIYRNSNKRNITHGDVDRWLIKMSRIIRDNIFSSFEGSEKLQEYQTEKTYKVFGEGYDYFEWVIEYILPGSVQDPNFIKVNLPWLDDDLTPPKIGLTQIEGSVPFKELVIPYDQVYERNEVIAFKYGSKKIDIGGVTQKHPIYWIGDNENWYILEPYWKASESIIGHDLTEWYFHDSGQLPFSNAIGVYKEDDDLGIRRGYKESLLRPYFEMGDEFDGFFSDNQAIGVNHAYPKVVQIELPCPTCSSGSGVSTGFEVVDIKGEKTRMQCRTCHGTKRLGAAGPLSTLTIPADMGFSETPIKPADAIHPVVYGEGQFTSRIQIGWDILDRARRSIGLDLMVDVSESGVAKEFRLEDLQDIIGNVVKHLHQFMQNDLWLKECLLEPNPKMRENPVFDIPTTFWIQDEKEVLKSIRELPVTERQDKMIDYYSKKYKADQVTEKIYEMSVIYAPTQLYTDEEVLQYASAGIFSKDQVVKGMYATWAMKQIGEAILKMKMEDIFAAADAIIEPRIQTSIPVNVYS